MNENVHLTIKASLSPCLKLFFVKAQRALPCQTKAWALEEASHLYILYKNALDIKARNVFSYSFFEKDQKMGEQYKETLKNDNDVPMKAEY